MTTAKSPLRVLKAQADSIAKNIIAIERGDAGPIALVERLAEARGRESIKVGIVMDDKVLMLTLPWTVIRGGSEVALAEFILKHMREQRDDA